MKAIFCVLTALTACGSVVKYEMPAPLTGTPEIVIEHSGYTVSYNTDHNTPNYVAWELTAAETTGDAERGKASFLPDPRLPQKYQVETSDYSQSGYDRGHMVPAADMKWSVDAMQECFYMSNICPQNHDLNGGSWTTLEEACRRWARREGAVYIVCGPIYEDGIVHQKIGKTHKIDIPEAFFKVVLSLKEGSEKAIGFIYANTGESQSMSATCMSVDAVEEITGIDFFTNLPDALEERVESTCSLSSWR